MILFEKFLQLDIDGYAIGVGQSREDVAYFCTPVGAKIIGWEGVDGIHYCFLPGYGDMVFTVNPMPIVDAYVYPLARNFEDFLRLILACKSAVNAEQIVYWDKEQFDSVMKQEEADNSEFAVQRKNVLDKIADVFQLQPMKYPFEYVKELQHNFDAGKIQYSDEYYDVLGIEREDIL